ncbi:Imm8 family immunity protein [Aneurinibacillus tyrosinisolvens]|uniref:Imm8 family immunity protein n=1 Tax=Aneurinibacillus tyrosinisolvens TaxID=1443435 RepID=UPI00063F13C7|nr:Imm8 family immunity protein [Aneurinibacillus tyrosinisolvens]
MVELKALTIINEEWGEGEDDFIVFLQIDIGEITIDAPSDLFTINVVSPRRLSKILKESEIEIGHGYFIMNDFNFSIIERKILRIIEISQNKSYEKSICILSKYFRNTNE